MLYDQFKQEICKKCNELECGIELIGYCDVYTEWLEKRDKKHFDQIERLTEKYKDEKAECKRLLNDYEYCMELIREGEYQIDCLKELVCEYAKEKVNRTLDDYIAELEKVLRWYADKKNYLLQGINYKYIVRGTDICDDCGQKARETLKEIE